MSVMQRVDELARWMESVADEATGAGTSERDAVMRAVDARPTSWMRFFRVAWRVVSARSAGWS